MFYADVVFLLYAVIIWVQAVALPEMYLYQLSHNCSREYDCCFKTKVGTVDIIIMSYIGGSQNIGGRLN